MGNWHELAPKVGLGFRDDVPGFRDEGDMDVNGNRSQP